MTRRPLTDAQLEARINEIEAHRAGAYMPPLYAGRPPVCLTKRRTIDRPGMHPTSDVRRDKLTEELRAVYGDGVRVEFGVGAA